MTAVEIEARLLQGADAEFGAGQRRFFQQELATYGVRADHVRAVARQVYAEIKRWPAAQRNRLMNDLWKLGKLEAGGLVCHVYRRFGRQCGACEFKLFESWIDRYVISWATGDGVASWLLAAAIANAPELRFRLEAWTAAPKRWKRRAAAVALLQEARHGRQTEWIFAIADRLLDDRDDMVEKGVGWLLKETYPQRPAETLAFLLARRERASRLTLRYAAEKMTARDRARLSGAR